MQRVWMVLLRGYMRAHCCRAACAVLKTPPVGNLWNLGESKNTLRKLADAREDVEMFELADEVPRPRQPM